MNEQAKKPLAELTDAELKQHSRNVEDVINGLAAMQTETPQEREQQEMTLQEALALGEALEMEQIRRLLAFIAQEIRSALTIEDATETLFPSDDEGGPQR